MSHVLSIDDKSNKKQIVVEIRERECVTPESEFKGKFGRESNTC